MTTSIFDMGRFQKLMRRQLFIKKRKAFFTILGLCTCFVFISLLVVPFQIGNDITSGDLQDMFWGITGTYLFALSAILTIPASSIMRDMKTKQPRISEFMLPGTMLEKYVTRVLFVTIGLFLMTAVSLVIADLLQQLLSMVVLHGAHASILKGLYQIINEYGASACGMSICVTLWINSLFLLGGMVFRKNAWALAMLVIVILSIFFNMVFFGFGVFLQTCTDYELYIPQVNWEMVLPCVFVALTLFNYWLGYIIYRRQQVINNRFFQI